MRVAMVRRNRSDRMSLAGGLAILAFLAACGPADKPAEWHELSEGAASLYVHPDSFDFSGNPQLLERIRANPHGYFRFINIPFSRQVCERFVHLIDDGPLSQDRFPFNLHGDAHVEQYAVTDLGRGLTDFDDSSEGPAWIDKVRFAVSLRLAARANGWEEEADAIVDELSRGYWEVIADSTLRAPIPAVAHRYQATFEHDSLAYHRWVDSIMQPLPDAEKLDLLAALEPYFELMLATHEKVTADFFRPEGVGALQLGVGSALEPKYLFRLRGPTGERTDDVIIELKRVRSLTGIPCIQADDDDPFRVLQAGARIAYQPFRFLGFVEYRSDMYWTHAWVANYREMKITESFRTPEELAEVAYDVGVQLGLGHLRDVGGPFQQMVKIHVQERASELEREVHAGSRVLADEVVEAWEMFVLESAQTVR